VTPAPNAPRAAAPTARSGTAAGNLWGPVAILACVITGVAAGAGLSGLATGAAAGASLALALHVVRRTGTVSSLLVLFTGFHALYGLSGVANVVAGATLHRIFSQPYAEDAFLMMYALATAGLVLGSSVGKAAGMLRAAPPVTPSKAASSHGLRWAAVAAAAAASVMELINLYRVGGSSILLLGKAVYQSEVEAIAFTLPSNIVANFAAAAFGVAASLDRRLGRRRSGPGLAAFAMALSPLLLVSVFLGRRGPILDWLFAAALGATFYTPVRRLPARLVAAAVALYLAMGYLFANRALLGITAVTGNWSEFWTSSLTPARLAQAVNPGANEFGAAFGNFSEYVHAGRQPLLLGSSYLRSPLAVVPAFLYPGTKPPQIWVEFRDTYFAAEARSGAIAGTAYSSILEAYVNFGPPGVFGVYFVLGAAAMALERRRGRTGSGALTYALLAPAAIIFHRSDLSAGLVGPLYYALVTPAAFGAAVHVLRLVTRTGARPAIVPSRGI
jgi:hypothetical protein